MDAAPAPLDELYGTHFHQVYRLCRSMLADPEDAADAAHDVFARAVKGAASWQSAEHARAWLMAVARHHCVDLLRRRERLARALARVGANPERTPDPEGVALNRHVVRLVLDALSPRDRLLLWQSAVERRPVLDIANHLQVSYQTAAKAVHRARRRAGLIAARVAIILGVIRLTRPVRRLAPIVVTAPQALLAALVPLIVASTASSAPSPASVAAQTLGHRSFAAARGNAGRSAAQPVLARRGSAVPPSPIVPATSIPTPVGVSMASTIASVHQRLLQTRIDADSLFAPLQSALPSVQPTSPVVPAAIATPTVTPTR